ncbi:MAG: RHS repeat-associated core domain-containing protein [Gammaproteobacteria bacterium]|nr:RHS repeat-associated core domain-containing protein [Gammaproteobacteria bacterium]
MSNIEHYQQTYTYDTGNNLTTLSHQANSSTWQQIINLHPNNNRGTETKQSTTDFDANGNLLTLENIGTLDWHYNNSLNKLTKKDKNTTEYYVYDHQNRRVRTVLESNQQRQNQRDYLPSLDISTNEDKQPTNTLHITAHILTETTKDTIESRYQLSSHLHSNTLELNDKAQTISYEHYYPYGGTALIAGKDQTQVRQKRYRYTSKETNDTSGLSYHHARYLAPWITRWISPDSAGTINGLNLYTYTTNNPLKYIDPTGHVAVFYSIEDTPRQYSVFSPALETFHSANLFHLPHAQQRLEDIVRRYPDHRLQSLDANTNLEVTFEESEGEGEGKMLKIRADTFFSSDNHFDNTMNFTTGEFTFASNFRTADLNIRATQAVAFQYLGMAKIAGAINNMPQKFLRDSITNHTTKNIMSTYQTNKDPIQFEYDFINNCDNGRSSFRAADILGLEISSVELDDENVRLHLKPQIPLRSIGNPRTLPPRQNIHHD